MGHLTAEAGDFVSALEYRHLSPQISNIVTTGIADCVAVILLGIGEPVTKMVSAYARAERKEATALWGLFRTSTDLSALVNATAAHSLDYDDTGLEGHPSAVLLPAILALGELSGADGRDMITAYVAGYEVWAELISRDEDKHHGKGFHPSGIFGAIAAAAAGAKILGLDTAATTTALSLSASMSSGLVANFGSMTKPFQLGRAAQSGVLAARLAAEGMTAANDALEHPAGFLAAYSPRGAVNRYAKASLGHKWRIETEGINIKLSPICYAAHRSIDSALSAVYRVDRHSSDIKNVYVRLGKQQSAMLRSRRPTTVLEAKFSVEFAVVAAILSRKVGLEEVSRAYLERPEVQDLLRKVIRIEVDETDAEQTLFSPSDQVTIEYNDGLKNIGDAIRFANGHARNRADSRKIKEKFRECALSHLAGNRIEGVFAKLCNLADIRRVEDLYS